MSPSPMVAGNESLYFLSAVPDEESFFSGAHLSVVVDRDCISWAVTERRSGKVYEIGRSERGGQLSSEEEAKRHTALHTRSYASGSIAFRGNPSVIVPKAIYQSEDQHAWMRYALGGEASVSLAEELRQLDAVLLTSVGEEDRQLTDGIPAGKLVSNACLFIGAMLRHSPSVSRPTCYADVSTSFVDLYLIDERGFLLYNTYDAHTPEDVIYHTANALQHLGIDTDRLQLRLSGSIGVESDTFKLYRSYFNDVSIHFGFGMPLVDLGLSSLRKQEFMSLLNQFACVS